MGAWVAVGRRAMLGLGTLWPTRRRQGGDGSGVGLSHGPAGRGTSSGGLAAAVDVLGGTTSGDARGSPSHAGAAAMAAANGERVARCDEARGAEATGDEDVDDGDDRDSLLGAPPGSQAAGSRVGSNVASRVASKVGSKIASLVGPARALGQSALGGEEVETVFRLQQRSNVDDEEEDEDGQREETEGDGEVC